VRECVKPLVESSIMLYDEVAAALRPIPTKPHYTFNLRDLSKVCLCALRMCALRMCALRIATQHV
jgi:dynein heavy chain